MNRKQLVRLCSRSQTGPLEGDVMSEHFIGPEGGLMWGRAMGVLKDPICSQSAWLAAWPYIPKTILGYLAHPFLGGKVRNPGGFPGQENYPVAQLCISAALLSFVYWVNEEENIVERENSFCRLYSPLHIVSTKSKHRPNWWLNDFFVKLHV